MDRARPRPVEVDARDIVYRESPPVRQEGRHGDDDDGFEAPTLPTGLRIATCATATFKKKRCGTFKIRITDESLMRLCLSRLSEQHVLRNKLNRVPKHCQIIMSSRLSTIKARRPTPTHCLSLLLPSPSCVSRSCRRPTTHHTAAAAADGGGGGGTAPRQSGADPLAESGAGHQPLGALLARPGTQKRQLGVIVRVVQEAQQLILAHSHLAMEDTMSVVVRIIVEVRSAL